MQHPTLFLLLTVGGLILLCYTLNSLRRELRALEATSNDAKAIRRSESMLLANNFRRIGIYLMASVMGCLFLIMSTGIITYQTTISVLLGYVILMILAALLFVARGAPGWIWRWLL